MRRRRILPLRAITSGHRLSTDSKNPKWVVEFLDAIQTAADETKSNLFNHTTATRGAIVNALRTEQANNPNDSSIFGLRPNEQRTAEAGHKHKLHFLSANSCSTPGYHRSILPMHKTQRNASFYHSILHIDHSNPHKTSSRTPLTGHPFTQTTEEQSLNKRQTKCSTCNLQSRAAKRKKLPIDALLRESDINEQMEGNAEVIIAGEHPHDLKKLSRTPWSTNMLHPVHSESGIGLTAPIVPLKQTQSQKGTESTETKTAKPSSKDICRGHWSPRRRQPKSALG